MKNLNCNEAKQISIISYLQVLGHKPKRKVAGNFWYCSPFRIEKTASFKVNLIKNSWYDFAEGIGGNIIDLGVKIHCCSVKDFLSYLATNSFPLQHLSPAPNSGDELSSITVIQISKLLDMRLLDYLANRKVDISLAQKYCSDVHYSIGDKKYHAIGFRNQLDGYELRNSIIKLSTSPKDITLITNGQTVLRVFEGFMDFLSFLSMKPALENSSDFLILNSTAFVSKAIEVVENYATSFLYLDRDSAGRRASDLILDSCISAVDASIFYSEFKDVNEWWCANEINHLRDKSNNQYGR